MQRGIWCKILSYILSFALVFNSGALMTSANDTPASALGDIDYETTVSNDDEGGMLLPDPLPEEGSSGETEISEQEGEDVLEQEENEPEQEEDEQVEDTQSDDIIDETIDGGLVGEDEFEEGQPEEQDGISGGASGELIYDIQPTSLHEVKELIRAIWYDGAEYPKWEFGIDSALLPEAWKCVIEDDKGNFYYTIRLDYSYAPQPKDGTEVQEAINLQSLDRPKWENKPENTLLPDGYTWVLLYDEDLCIQYWTWDGEAIEEDASGFEYDIQPQSLEDVKELIYAIWHEGVEYPKWEQEVERSLLPDAWECEYIEQKTSEPDGSSLGDYYTLKLVYEFDDMPETQEDIQASIDSWNPMLMKPWWKDQPDISLLPDGYKFESLYDEELCIIYWTWFEGDMQIQTWAQHIGFPSSPVVGDKYKFGSLYVNNTVQANPTYPWQNGSTPSGAPGAGNIPNYSSGNIEIRDSHTTDANKINWVYVGDNKYISDRNILVNVSWNTLNSNNFVTGVTKTIDGQSVKISLPTGGVKDRTSGNIGYNGGTPTDNDWDRYIQNEISRSGLVTPNSTDKASGSYSTQASGASNQMWNWRDCYSWMQEAYQPSPSSRVVRGSVASSYLSYDGASNPNTIYGFRPVLEVLNAAPLVTAPATDQDLGAKYSGFTQAFTVNDSDGDSFSILAKVDNTTVLNTSNNSNGNFSLNITGSTWTDLSFGSHTITITVTDTKGAASTRTLTFDKSNTSPVINSSDSANLGNKDVGFSISYNITDAESNPVTVTEKLDGAVIGKNGDSVTLGQDNTIIISDATLKGLSDGSHVIRVEANDSHETTIKEWTFTKVSYSVTYALNGGSGTISDSNTYILDDTVTISSIEPTRTHYDFDGWLVSYTDSSDSTLYQASGSFTMPAYNVTFTAQWSLRDYTISFEPNGGSAVDAVIQNYNTSISASPSSTKTGYTLDGWYTDDGTFSDKVLFPYTITGDKTLYAKWNINSYNVTTTTVIGGTITGTGSKVYNSSVTLDATPDTGYIFDGWEDNAYLTGTQMTFTMPANAVSLVPKWKKIDYTITLVQGAHGTILADTTANYQDTVNITVTPDDGYALTGWTDVSPVGVITGDNTSFSMPASDVTMKPIFTAQTVGYKVEHYQQAINGTDYDKVDTDDLTELTDETVTANPKDYTGFTVQAGTMTGTVLGDGSLILKVYYTRNSYEVTFDTDGGSSVAGVTVLYEDLIPSPSVSIKQGYHIEGWYDGSTKWNFSTMTMPASNKTLKVNWEPNTDTPYLVRLYWQNILDNGYTAPTEDTRYGTTGTTASLTVGDITPLYGFVFNSGTSTTSGNIAPNGSLILSAYFDRALYEVTFNSNGGTPVSKISNIKYEATIEAPQEPTKTGHTFKHWKLLTDEYIFGAPITDDIELVAAWDVNAYKVTLIYNNGSSNVEANINYGSLLTRPEEPTKTGYTFSGWYNGEDEWDFTKDTVGVGGVILNAKWTINSYDVTFDSNGGAAVAGQYLEYNSKVAKPEDPYFQGYHLEGWYYGQTKWDFDNDLLGAADMELVANWAPNTNTPYTVEHWGQDIIGDGYSLIGSPVGETGTTDEEATASHISQTGFHAISHTNEKLAGDIAPDGSLVLKLYYDRDTFDIDFNVNDGDSISSQIIRYGGVVQEPLATRLGYTISHWYLLDEGTPYSFGTAVTSDLTLNAKWIPNSDTTYYVEFYYQSILDDDDYALVDTDARDGTTDTEAFATVGDLTDPTGFAYNASKSKSSGNINPDGLSKLKLYFDRLKYDITFNSNGGTDVDAVTEVKYQDTISAPTEPTKTGHTFKHWTLAGVEYVFGSPVTDNMTLIADWDVNKYKVTLIYNNGDADVEADIPYGSLITTPVEPIRVGYTFKGWYNGEDKWNFDGDTVDVGGVTLAVKWEANINTPYKIQHYLQNITDDGYTVDEDVDELTGTTDTTVDVLAYVRNYTGFDVVDDTVSGNLEPDGSQILKVYYNRQLFDMSFESNGGGTVANITDVRYEGTIQEPTEPTKAEYAFIGWYTDDGTFLNQVSFPYTIISDITVYAHWYKVQADGTHLDERDDQVYMPVGGVHVPVTDNGNGTWIDDDGNVFLSNFSGGFIAVIDNQNGSYTDKSDSNTTYINNPGAQGYVQVEIEADGSYKDQGGTYYLPKPDGNFGEFVSATKNTDGSYTETVSGDTQIPVNDGFIVVVAVGDGTYKDEKTDDLFLLNPNNGSGEYIKVAVEPDGAFKDSNGNYYVPDMSGVVGEFTTVNKNPDGSYVDDNARLYIPNPEGSLGEFLEVTSRPDGAYDGVGANSDSIYIPGQGGFMPVEENGNGTYIDENGQVHLPQNGGFTEVVDNNNGSYTDNDNNTFLPRPGGGGYVEVINQPDGSFKDVNDSDIYYVSEPGGSQGQFVSAGKNPDGSYTDDNGDYYIPLSDGSFIDVTPNPDGSYSDGSNQLYVPTPDFTEVTKNPDGSFKDNSGQIYIAVPDFTEVTENADGSYIDGKGEVYVPTPAGDDIFTNVTKNGDGYYEDENGKLYIPISDGNFLETDREDNGAFISDDGTLYIQDPSDSTNFIKVEEQPDGTFIDDSGKEYISVPGGTDFTGITKNPDGTLDGDDGNLYIPTDDGFDEVTLNSDGSYKNDDGDFYIPDGSGAFSPVDKNLDGTYTDEHGGVYMPTGDGSFLGVTENPDGSYAGDDGKTYILGPDSEPGDFTSVTKNPDGSYTDYGGTIYVPTPGGTFEDVTSNGDGSYTDDQGQIYIPTPGGFDEVDRRPDGSFENNQGEIYIQGPDGEFVGVDANADGSYTTGSGETYIPIENGFTEVTKQPDESFKDDNDTIFVLTEDGFDEVTKNPDGSFINDEGDIYILTENGFDSVSPMPDGSYVDDSGQVYIPRPGGSFTEVDINDDESYTDKDGNTYIPASNGNFEEVTKHPDGAFEDTDGNFYIPTDNGFDKATPNQDGSYTDSQGNIQIPTPNGEFEEVTKNPDGSFEDSAGGIYIPGKDGSFVEVTPEPDGSYVDGGGGMYVPKPDGGFEDVIKNPDGSYTDDSGTVYIPNGDGSFTDVTDNGDGSYTDDSGQLYIPTPSGDFEEVTKNPDGSYVDGSGQIYIPTDSGFDEARPNLDGSYTDSNGNIHIPTPDGEFSEVTKNPDGVYEDGNGNLYIPTDNGFEEVEANKDGGYTDKNGNIHIPTENGLEEVIKNPDGSFEDSDGNLYIPTPGGNFEEVTKNPDGSFETGNGDIYIIAPGGEFLEVEINPNGGYIDGSGNVYVPGVGGEFEQAFPEAQVSVSSDKANVKVGETFVYTIIVKNTGNGIWENATVSVKLPDDVTFIDSNSLVSTGGTGLVLMLGDIAVGQGITVTVTVKVNVGVYGGTLSCVVSALNAEAMDEDAPQVINSLDNSNGSEGSGGGQVITEDVPKKEPEEVPIPEPKAGDEPDPDDIDPINQGPGEVIDGKLIVSPTELQIINYGTDGSRLDYVGGYPDQTFRPDNNVTRGEAAVMIHQLLRDFTEAPVNNFADVNVDDWYASSVNYLNWKGVLGGYMDGNFRPDNQISRAEAVSIIARMTGNEVSGVNKFTDTRGHWAENHINAAVRNGWVSGYPDGDFKPNQPITRAEMVTIINRVLERRVSTEHVIHEANKFEDISPDHWAYADILEATVTKHIDPETGKWVSFR